jgi:hypothetical protein
MKNNKIINGQLFCSKCQIYKNISEFYIFNGRPKSPCKYCKKQYQNKFSLENKENIKIYKKKYYAKNSSKLIANQLIRDSKRLVDIKRYQSNYRKANKSRLQDKKQIYRKNKRKTDPAYKLRAIVSNAIYQSIKYNSGSKRGSSFLKYVAYSVLDLKKYLESKFEPWMTWQNWGIYNPKIWNTNDQATWTWQIDHIVPQVDFPYTSMEDDNFKKCWSLENLRPLSSKQNIIKGSK